MKQVGPSRWDEEIWLSTWNTRFLWTRWVYGVALHYLMLEDFNSPCLKTIQILKSDRHLTKWWDLTPNSVQLHGKKKKRWEIISMIYNKYKWPPWSPQRNCKTYTKCAGKSWGNVSENGIWGAKHTFDKSEPISMKYSPIIKRQQPGKNLRTHSKNIARMAFGNLKTKWWLRIRR